MKALGKKMNVAAFDKEALYNLFYFSLPDVGGRGKKYARRCENKRIRLSRYETEDISDYSDIESGE